VSLFVLALVAAMPLVVRALARRMGARQWPATGAALASAYFLTQWAAGERPQTLTYVFFPLALLLARDALAGSNRALGQLGLLFVAWSNFHLAFTAGLAAIGCVAVFDGLQHRRLPRAASVVAVAGIAGLCNPYFLGAYTSSLSVRAESKAVDIAEWEPLRLAYGNHRVGLFFLLLGFVALARTGRFRCLDVVVPIVVFTALTFDARRNLPFAVTLVAPEIALALPALHGGLAAYASSRRFAFVAGAVAGLGLMTVTALAALADLRPVAAPDYPVEGVVRIPAGCRLLNEYAVGGYITARRYPDVRVSQDGRNNLYGVEAIAAQTDVLAARGNWLEWIDDNEVNCALVTDRRAIVDELAARGWTTEGTDPGWVLLLRR
jgi:hypothetical protein